MTGLSSVGKSVARVDALSKVTGEAVYATDIKLTGMLHAKVLRSPHPHARILGIDTTRAANLTGVRCVLTGKDAPDKKFGVLVLDRYVLARDVVRFAGEPVAAVAAETVEIAEEAIRLVEVKYEVLPAIFDSEEAMGTNPPAVVHPDLFKYGKSKTYGGPRFDADRPNVFYHMKIRKGDVDTAFKEADLVIENRFTTPRVQHCALEPHVTIARQEANGDLTMWVGRQFMWRMKDDIGALFGLQPSQIRIIQTYVGGAFGGKIVTNEEPLVALLAIKSRRPVKLVFTRQEVFVAGGSRESQVVYIKDGFKKDGTLIAREMRAVIGGGAYEGNIGILTRFGAFATLATYRASNLRWDSYGVYLHEPPACAFRGFGSMPIIWAIESHMDMAAEKLGIDPVELRRKNIMAEGETNGAGEMIHATGARLCLDKVAESIRLEDKPKGNGVWKRGKGLAVANKCSSAPTSAVGRVKVAEDGSIIVYHGADELGQGCNTVAAQIAAEEFGISPEKVKVVFSDTLTCPFFAGGSTSSRVTFNLGNATILACRDAKKSLFSRAAERLQASPDELETRDGRVYLKSDTTRSVKIAELFLGFRGDFPGGYGSYVRGGEIVGNSTWIQDYTPEDPETGQIDPAAAAKGKRLVTSYAYLAKGVEVAVNTETGHIKVISCVSANDMGQPINPKMIEQQAEGGDGMGIGDSLYEELKLKDGIVINPDFLDYLLPTATEMPESRNHKTIIAPVNHRGGPYGAKGGWAEATQMAMQPAIANAVYDAIGVRIKDLPITAEKVLRALKEKGSGRL